MGSTHPREVRSIQTVWINSFEGFVFGIYITNECEIHQIESELMVYDIVNQGDFARAKFRVSLSPKVFECVYSQLTLKSRKHFDVLKVVLVFDSGAHLATLCVVLRYPEGQQEGGGQEGEERGSGEGRGGAL